jgi:hypothetical protein
MHIPQSWLKLTLFSFQVLFGDVQTPRIYKYPTLVSANDALERMFGLFTIYLFYGSCIFVFDDCITSGTAENDCTRIFLETKWIGQGIPCCASMINHVLHAQGKS